MEAFSKYIISIVAVCIVISVIRKLTAGQSTSTVIRVLCGIVLTVIVISPVVKLRISDLSHYANDVQADADAFVQKGVQQSEAQLRSIINDDVTAYILEKASVYDCSIHCVEVVLSEDGIPVPDAVRITGIYSPHIKKNLSDIIETNLGIPKEKQQWTYQS